MTLKHLALALCAPLLCFAAETLAPSAQPGSRDPFDLQRIDRSPPSPSNELALQHFALSQLRMVGTLSADQRRWALLLDPQQHIYLVPAGSKLGPHQGVVQRITEDEVLVEERWQDQQGKWQLRTVRLSMEKKS
jgi:Tfp pilus assembly protein PilP